jgi:hypothetical protein
MAKRKKRVTFKPETRFVVAKATVLPGGEKMEFKYFNTFKPALEMTEGIKATQFRIYKVSYEQVS